MQNSIDEALNYASQHDGYRAVLGIISAETTGNGILAWGAFNQSTGENYVPNMSRYLKTHPQARWNTLTPKELRHYLSNRKETAFLYSQRKIN